MRRNNLFWGIVLALIGLMLLIDNLGLLAPLNIDAGDLIWPLVLIGLGIWLLWTSLGPEQSFETETLAIPLEGAEHADVDLHFGAGEIRLHGAAEPGHLLNGTFAGVRHTLDREASIAKLKLSTPQALVAPWMWANRGRLTWNFSLSDALPLSINLESGASDVELDLRQLKVTRLRLETGANATRVHLPQNAGHTEVRGSSGAASVDLYVPEGVAARIKASGAIASVDVDTRRFPSMGQRTYQSPDYENAENKVDIQLDIGVGSISVH